VFGATGFLGRYIVNRLSMSLRLERSVRKKDSLWCAAQKGCTVVVPYREEMAKRHLKLTGDLGRVIFMVRNRSLAFNAGTCVAYEYNRNMTFAILNLSRRVSVTRMWCTISWAGHTQPSMLLCRESRPASTHIVQGTSLWKTSMSKGANV
jgi:hypothetical protein